MGDGMGCFPGGGGNRIINEALIIEAFHLLMMPEPERAQLDLQIPGCV